MHLPFWIFPANSSSSLLKPPGHSFSYEARIGSGSVSDSALLEFSVAGDDESDSASVEAAGLETDGGNTAS